jgi:hypothetical protein
VSEPISGKEASLIDALTTEEQLTEARLSLIRASLSLGQLIAELHFQTGVANDRIDLPLTTDPAVTALTRRSR